MVTRTIGSIAELLAIAFGFFVISVLLNITGVGVKLYGIEQSQGTYVVEFFLGMACAAAFIQIATVFSSISPTGSILQSLLPPVFSFVALLVAMWVIGIEEVLLGSIVGNGNEGAGLFAVCILFGGCFIAAFMLQKAPLNGEAISWRIAIIPCFLGVLMSLYLAPQGASKIAVGACFVGGFIAYSIAKTLSGHFFSIATAKSN